jgi:CubicO group peptidase (beta-lactamase class C family)
MRRSVAQAGRGVEHGPVDALVALPAQPANVPWPTDDWPTGVVPPGVDVDGLLDELFTSEVFGTTYATVVIQHGRVLAERYGGAITHWDKPDEPVDATTQLLSWSMAKSFTHAAVGVLGLDVDAPANVPAWRDDERSAITLDHLLCMRDGLDFSEDYVDAGVSDVIEMLFGAGKDDVLTYAESRPLRATPGERFNYSSGTSNIVSGILSREVGRGPDFERFLTTRLLEPIGIRNARLGFDAAGTFIGSSFLYMPAREFAKFGLLYLRGGTWDGTRIVPEAWVDHGRTPRSTDGSDGRIHGAHWWCTGDDLGSWWASGYDGQSILLCPALDLIVVRLGWSPGDDAANALFDWRRRVVDAFRVTA